jgi:hypothetical protein
MVGRIQKALHTRASVHEDDGFGRTRRLRLISASIISGQALSEGAVKRFANAASGARQRLARTSGLTGLPNVTGITARKRTERSEGSDTTPGEQRAPHLQTPQRRGWLSGNAMIPYEPTGVKC